MPSISLPTRSGVLNACSHYRCRSVAPFRRDSAKNLLSSLALLLIRQSLLASCCSRLAPTILSPTAGRWSLEEALLGDQGVHFWIGTRKGLHVYAPPSAQVAIRLAPGRPRWHTVNTVPAPRQHAEQRGGGGDGQQRCRRRGGRRERFMTSPRHCQPPRVKKSVSFCDSVTFAEEISVSGHAHNAWLSCSDAGTPLEASSFSDFARQASAVPPRLPEQQEAKMDSAENGGLNYSASASPKSPRGGGSGGGGGRNGFRRGSGGSIDGGLSLGKMGSISSSSDCGSGGNSSPTRMWDHWKLPRVNVPFYSASS